MQRASDELSSRGRGTLAPATAQLVAWLLVGSVTAVCMQLVLGNAPEGWRVRAHHQLLNLGQHFALGATALIAVATWQRVGIKRRLAVVLASFVFWSLLGAWVLPEDLAVFASKLAERVPTALVMGALIGSVALGLALVPLTFGRGPRWLRLVLGVVFALSLGIGNNLILRGDYPGVHLVMAVAEALCFGLALSEGNDMPGRGVLIGVAATLPVALWSLVASPPNAVALDITRSSGSIVAPWLSRLRRPPLRNWTPSTDPWLRSRRAAADVAPSKPTALPKNGIVLVLTADCVRADVVSKPGNLARFPALSRLQREGITFTQARTTAPATTQAITSIFTSTFYSQLQWANLPGKGAEYYYPHLDKTPRLGELLSQAQVHTASVQGLPGISARTGLVRGIQTERILPPAGGRFAGSELQLPVILEVLEAQRAGPLFLYAHFDDPHAPYDRAGNEGPDFERYLREVGLVDTALGAILTKVDELGIADRTAVLFSADHGEAFGEHGAKLHATSLYDELLRVPLLVRLPGFSPRVIDEPVSLVDIAPSILDLFGLPTPGLAMGQSLVPLMRDGRPPLERPLAFESGRAIRAVLFRDRMKLIQNLRAGTVELFDLSVDPEELHNLADRSPVTTDERLRRTEQLFAAHRFEAPGYELPFAR